MVGVYVPQTNPIHLYRALLRESSYLFDPAARKCCDERVRREFRKKRDQLFNDASAQSSPFPGQVELHQLKRGRKFLSFLQRANLGHRKPVENVLALAYARKGARRHKIISKFEHREEDEDTTSIADHASREFRPPRAFQGLLKAHKVISNYLKRDQKIMSGPDVPNMNKLGYPFPQRRVRKVNVKWHQRHTDLLSAPLSEHHWNRVASYVYRRSGTALKPVARRTQASHKVYADGEDEPFTPPKLLRKIRLAIGNPHRLSRRFLRRRLQQTVLANTPTPLARSSHNDTVYRWSAGPQALPIPKLLTDSQRIVLFR